MLACWHRLRVGRLAAHPGHEPVFLPKENAEAAWAGPAEQGLMTMETHKEIDTRAELPLPILKAKKALAEMASGQLLEGIGHRCGVGARLPGVCQSKRAMSWWNSKPWVKSSSTFCAVERRTVKQLSRTVRWAPAIPG